MRIFIDADGCPVVDITVDIAVKYNLECFILCDTAHVFDKKGADTLIFPKGADSVDFALVNLVKNGDIVVTQDYGLAAMCLAKKAIPISQNGLIYNDDNIDQLLYTRHISQKIRSAGGRVKGPSKRTKKQDEMFETVLEKFIQSKLD